MSLSDQGPETASPWGAGTILTTFFTAGAAEDSPSAPTTTGAYNRMTSKQTVKLPNERFFILIFFH